MSIVGRSYLERGEPVIVVAQWRSGRHLQPHTATGDAPVVFLGVRRSPLRNVLIRRSDGTLVVRPFRGLRKAHDALTAETEPT